MHRRVSIRGDIGYGKGHCVKEVRGPLIRMPDPQDRTYLCPAGADKEDS